MNASYDEQANNTETNGSRAMYTLKLVPLIAALSLSLGIGCSEQSTGTPDVIDDTFTPDTDGNSGDSQDDADDEEIDDFTAEIGKECEDDGDCITNFCARVDGVSFGFCSLACNDVSDCPEVPSSDVQFSCEVLQTANDLNFACVREDFCFDPDNDTYGFGPGCFSIAEDCAPTDPDINPGATETCDFVDMNCDGSEWLGAVWASGNETCITDEPGVCARGVRICDPQLDGDGNLIDVQSSCALLITPGARPETCDGVDTDCDGLDDADDMDIPGIGQRCSTGASSCLDGIRLCDPDSGGISCVLDEDSNFGDELCDGVDNDCDEEVDEDFKDSDGVFSSLEHCGGCNIDCTEQLGRDPASINYAPACTKAGGDASCTYSCLDGFVDADGFSENGCEFEPDEQAVYVSQTEGADSGSCGTWDAPCATLSQALNRASNSGRSRLLVASGAYAEFVSMQDGISMLGGYNARTWDRNIDVNVTSISGSASDGNDYYGLLAEDIINPTELSGFTITGPSAEGDGNAIGVLVSNSNNNLTLRDNLVYAGAAGSGVNGDDGDSGSSGADGSNGRASIYRSGCAPGNTPGGAGGSATCGGEDVSGGTGAYAERCPDFEENQPDGDDGSGDNGGEGGDSRRHQENSSGFICSGESSSSSAGENGGNGGNGSAASPVNDNDGYVSGSSWRGAPGDDGDEGSNGSGGGGGGAGGGIEVEDTNNYYIGATGGGGGAGGCSGERGTGGTAGGASFAILVVGNGFPTIEANLLSRGPGGDGGRGGNGGAGGTGGLGGQGGERDFSGGGKDLVCLYPGEKGGDGGRGGHGSAGGGGAGGVSFDIATLNGDAPASYASSNTFALDGGVSTAGRGGKGGNAPVLSIVGPDGVAGAFGNVGRVGD